VHHHHWRKPCHAAIILIEDLGKFLRRLICTGEVCVAVKFPLFKE
jgi:hypothetical protein